MITTTASRRICYALSLVLAGVFFSNPANAESSNVRTKLGLFGKGLVTNSFQTPGWLSGAEYVRYVENGILYFGLRGAYGEAPTTPTTSLLMGGISLGLETVSGRWLWGGSLGLTVAQAHQSGIIVGTTYLFAGEPELYTGIVIGAGWRLGVSAGYLFVATQSDLSGLTGGLRLDYKSESTSHGVDN